VVAIDKDTIRRWRSEADARRIWAAGMADLQARLGILNAARSYDALADNAEARVAGAADERAGF
jgi:hypothetical protein